MDHPTNGPTPGPDATSGADPVMAGLVDALSRTGAELATQPVPQETAEQHLAAITAAAAAHAHTAPATAAAAPTWGARVRRVLGLTGAKVALGAGVAAAATGGLAAGGNLPDPVQTVISDGAAWFGVDLPSPERSPDPRPELPDEVNSEAEDAVSEAPVPEDGADVPSPAPGPPFSDVPPSEVVPTEVPRPEITPPGGPPPGTTPSEARPSGARPQDDPPRDERPSGDDPPAPEEAPDHAAAPDPGESPTEEGASGSGNRGGPLIGTTQAADGSSSVPTTGRSASG